MAVLRSGRSRSVLVMRGRRVGTEATMTQRLSSTMAHEAADVSLTRHETVQLGKTLGHLSSRGILTRWIEAGFSLSEDELPQSHC